MGLCMFTFNAKKEDNIAISKRNCNGYECKIGGSLTWGVTKTLPWPLPTLQLQYQFGNCPFSNLNAIVLVPHRTLQQSFASNSDNYRSCR